MYSRNIPKSYDEAIARLERLCGGKERRKPSRSDDESFRKAFTKMTKELRELGAKVVMKKAAEAGLGWHELELLEVGLKKGKRLSPDFLRSIGISVEGKVTRQERREAALAAMGEALEKGEISFREFTKAEDLLNRGTSAEIILKALRSRRREDDEQEEQRLEKAEKKQTIRVTEKREVPLSLLMSPDLTSEQEALLQNLGNTDPWVGRMIADSFGRKFL